MVIESPEDPAYFVFSHKGVVKGLVSFAAALWVKRMLQKRVTRLFKRR